MLGESVFFMWGYYLTLMGEFSIQPTGRAASPVFWIHPPPSAR
jgi:hypothetical protein